MNGVELIAAERLRQKTEEGWTDKHDDEHTNGELAIAGASYAWPNPRPLDIKLRWPWSKTTWKPCLAYSNDAKERISCRIRELVKGGALIAAEIDRLQRLIV